MLTRVSLERTLSYISAFLIKLSSFIILKSVPLDLVAKLFLSAEENILLHPFENVSFATFCKIPGASSSPCLSFYHKSPEHQRLRLIYGVWG